MRMLHEMDRIDRFLAHAMTTEGWEALRRELASQ